MQVKRCYRKATVTDELKSTVGRIEQLCDKFNTIVKEMNEGYGSKVK